MDIEIKIIKGIPTEQIQQFEDKVVYYSAMATRDYVKSRHGYPKLTGELRRNEIAAPITGSNKVYNLLTGVDYATQVYNYTNVNWTNPSTLPQWYYTAFRMRGNTLTTSAVIRALKEIKK